MNLENTLRQKAEAKAAEILRQEQEQKIAAAQVERAHEEARLLGLQQSVSDIDARIKEMRSLLIELKQAHEQAEFSVTGAKKEGEELTKATAKLNNLFANKEFREILVGEGIESLDDLLQAEEYSEQEEVKSVKGLRGSRTEKRQEAREQIGARRQAKNEAHKTITTEAPDVPQKRTYKDVTAALEDCVRELENERKTVFSQTPEGQETLKAEILDKIKQRYKQTFSYYRLASKQEINNRQTIAKDDIENAKEYDEDKVKTALKDYYGQVIDNELDEEAKKNGQPQLQEAVNIIENLPKQWQEIRSTLGKLQQARREIINRLAELLGNNRNAPLFQQMNSYGHWNCNDPQKLAETFVNAKSASNSYTLGLGMGPTGPLEIIVEKIISDQENLLEQTHKENSEKAFSRADADIGTKNPNPEQYRFQTALDNPERIVIILAEQAEFYQKFQAALTTPEEVRDNVVYKEIYVKSEYDLGLGVHGQIKSQIDFDGKTYATLRDNPLSQIKTRLEQQQKEMEKTAIMLKEQIGDKVEVDWDSAELSMFQNDRENRQSIQEAERMVRMQKIAEELSPYLDSAISGLQEQMNQQLSFDMYQRGKLKFNSVHERDLLRLHNEIDKLQDEIKKIEVGVRSINQRAASEGDGLLGGKKKKREKEKATFDEQKKTLQERLQNAQAEYQPKFEIDQKLGRMRAFIERAKEKELELQFSSSSFSLREMIDSIKKQMNFKLTPEQFQIYEQYQALKKKMKQTEERYHRKY